MWAARLEDSSWLGALPYFKLLARLVPRGKGWHPRRLLYC